MLVSVKKTMLTPVRCYEIKWVSISVLLSIEDHLSILLVLS